MSVLERIDVHGHYFPPEYQKALKKHKITLLDGVLGPQWSEEIQSTYQQELNISKSILSISSPYFYFGDQMETNHIARCCNDYGADYEQRNSSVHVCGVVPLPDVTSAIEEVKYCREHLKIHDFSLLSNIAGIYLGDDKLEPLMVELNKEKTVVILHPTTPVIANTGAATELPAAVMEYFFETTRAVTNMILKGTIHKYPNIRFVVPHGGAFLTILSDRLNALTQLLHIENLDIWGDLASLYYDLAGFAMPKQFDLLKKVTDASHIMYGSDAPFTPIVGDKKLAKEMDDIIAPNIRDMIYVENAKTLFSL